MNFPSIDIQGSILSTDLLAKIRSEQATYQHGKDFNSGLTDAKLKDEISAAWQEAKGQWNIFKSKLTRLKEGESGTTETRNFWIAPLLTNLGYNLTFSRASEELNGKTFPISYRDSSLDNFPVYIGGFHESLDKRPENKQLLVSPHAMLQEYLNYSDHLYGMVTNGRQLRLLRDASRITRLSYVEFNLEKMMEEDLYSDFVIFYRVMHASRMPQKIDAGAESIIEKYHQEALEAGSTIRSKLGFAVKGAIQSFANGFINHPDNAELRKVVADEKLDADEFYRHLLRIIYRLLFLFVIEERNLVYANSKTAETKRFSRIYFHYFSLMRLRKLARNLLPPEANRHHDLWQGLMSTFSLFEKKGVGEKLGIMALQGDLFGYEAISNNQYDLHQCQLSNAVLLHIIKSLSYFENDNGVLIAVNYGGLDVEEFGSVYEGLLELRLDIKKIEASDQYRCSFHSSSERSKSGSHYTPEELVQPLIKHSLDYLIAERVESAESREASSKWSVASSKYPALAIQIKNLIINLSLKYEKLSGLGSLEKGNGFSPADLPINQLLSQRGIVWNDFSTPEVSKLYTGKHSRGLGTKYQQGVQSLSEHSQRQPEGDGNSPDVSSQGKSVQAGANQPNPGTFNSAEQANTFIATFHLSQKQLAQVWNYLPFDIRHSLFTTHHLLGLKVADVACGSGHILLSAARRIAHELACLVETRESGSKQKVEQPSPTSVRKAMKDVVRNCIYGVDKNSLAVELCKIALWLEAYNPGEPLNFLDHHIKCGDAIVGLAHRTELENGIADEAFKTLPGDDKDIAAAFRKRNQQERKQKGQTALDYDAAIAEEVNAVIEKFNLFKNLPENTPEEVERKTKEHFKYEHDQHRIRLKQIADTQIAQFFISKTEENKDCLMTDAEYRNLLRQVNKHLGVLQSNKIAKAQAIAGKDDKNFFHWFLEFPEVFSSPFGGGREGAGGFDCILGNPPFLGGQKLSGTYGDNFLECIKYEFAPIGAVDLVTYFFRRIFTIIKQGGFQSLISTNTIAQGKAREEGLDVIVKQGGTINHAVRSTRWPGVAAVEVALVTITKQQWKGKFYLGTKEVKTITPYLDDAETLGNPFPLKQNENKSFQGSIVLGKGFVLEPEQAAALIAKDPRNKEVLFPYLNGDDLNNNPDQSPSRWVINFFDWPEEKAKTYPDCYEIIEREVKPEREKMKGDRGAEYWWQFLRMRKELYQTIAPLERVLVINNHTRHHVFGIYSDNIVYSHALSVLAYSNLSTFSIVSTSLTNEWAWHRGSTMGATTLRYTSSEIIETFPFPQNLTPQQEQQLEIIGSAYHEHRRQLMLGMQLGLTKTYNLFHDAAVSSEGLAAKGEEPLATHHPPLSKNLQALIKHLDKTPCAISLEEAIKGIEKLRELHVQMDEAVCGAYGWEDLLPSPAGEGPGVRLHHSFYEVDYLPENDRVRFTIHPDARKEVLKRLLELNHKIHDEEVKAGLWDKKQKSQKKKSKSQTSDVNEPQAGYGGKNLFNQGE